MKLNPRMVIIFVIIQVNITRRVHFVGVSHTVDNTITVIYASLISIDIVHIALLVVSLDYLDALSDNIQNSYPNILPREKAWFQAGSKFG